MTTAINVPVPMDLTDHQRVEYFAGQFLEDKDFQSEQKYHLMRRRRLNQELFSHGVRRGFTVVVEQPEQKSIRVHPGAGMDFRGRELWLEKHEDLQFPPQADGEYFLCMQVLEKPAEWKTYVDPAVKKNDVSEWKGNTRNVESIEFSLFDKAHKIDPAYIKLARMQCKDGNFSVLVPKQGDPMDRDISTASLGSGLTINPSGHYIDMYHKGELNAYIGPEMAGENPHTVTFSSMSKRMDFAGDQPLYMFNKGGVVIANERGGDRAGILHVQGKANLQGGVNVTQGVKKLGTWQELAINGTTLASVESSFGVTIHSGTGKLSLEGASALHITNKSGVVISKDKDASGSLVVEGTTTLQNGVKVTGDAHLDGSLEVGTELKITGATFKSVKRGVVIEKGFEGNDDLLTVKGAARVEEDLYVHQHAVIEASLQVMDGFALRSKLVKGARMIDGELKKQELRIAGAEFTYHSVDVPGVKLFSEERMHISGEKDLYLLHKKGVVIGKDWYPDKENEVSESGRLTVQGKATVNELEVQGQATAKNLTVKEQAIFRDFALHSPGSRNLHNIDDVLDKLKKDGDFIFFVEEVKSNARGVFWVLWRSNGRIVRQCLSQQ